MKISIVQMNSGNNIQKNLDVAEKLIAECCITEQPDLVALPEYFSFISGSPAEMLEAGKELEALDVASYLSSLASKYNVGIHAGSSLIHEDGKLYNQSIIHDREGNLVQTYRKIHLFDIVLPNGNKMFESDFISRGDSLAHYQVDDFNIGCTICFDIRYPEIYAKLAAKRCDIIMVPAAFTFATGSEHWEVLLRARAIETQCYIVAPAQVFSFSDGKYQSWGHSMIIDPWGTIVAQMPQEQGFISARISRKSINDVRARIPVQANRFWSNGHE